MSDAPVEPVKPHPKWCGHATPVRLQAMGGELLSSLEPQPGAMVVRRRSFCSLVCAGSALKDRPS